VSTIKLPKGTLKVLIIDTDVLATNIARYRNGGTTFKPPYSWFEYQADTCEVSQTMCYGFTAKRMATPALASRPYPWLPSRYRNVLSWLETTDEVTAYLHSEETPNE
jgi:hypothetical protein